MAVMIILSWEGVTPEQYDAVRKEVRWLEEAPVGGRLHTAAFGDGVLYCTDVWDSAEDFQRFVDERLMPEVQRQGLPGQPEIEIVPLHELYCPVPDQILAT
jgi:hypothetical protein